MVDETTKPLTFADLSAREQEIALLIGEDKTTDQIADELEISMHTVRTHIKNAIRKLEVKSRAALAAHGARAETLGQVGSWIRLKDLYFDNNPIGDVRFRCAITGADDPISGIPDPRRPDFPEDEDE